MKDAPPINRMLIRAQTTRLARILRDPLEASIPEMHSLLINAGGPQAANDARDMWLVHTVRRMLLDRGVIDEDDASAAFTEDEARVLLLVDLDMEATIEANLASFISPADRAAHFSDPDEKSIAMKYGTWLGRYEKATWRPGQLVLVDGPMGKGKSHVVCLMGEHALEMGWYCFFNVGLVKAKVPEYEGRVQQVDRLSDFIKAWARTPPGSRVFLGLDEVESFLRGGNTNAVKRWENLVWHFRKWGVMCAEIWHNAKDAHRSLREDSGGAVLRIKKDTRYTMTVEVQVERDHGEDVTVSKIENRVSGLPPLSLLEFDSEASGTFEVDVQVERLIAALSGLDTEAKRKAKALELVESGAVLVEDDEEEVVDLVGAALDRVRADPDRFRNSRGRVDADLVRLAVRGLPHRDAQSVAKAVNQEEARLSAAFDRVSAEPDRFRNEQGQVDAELVRGAMPELPHRDAQSVAEAVDHQEKVRLRAEEE